jgi:hypothetical protein
MGVPDMPISRPGLSIAPCANVRLTRRCARALVDFARCTSSRTTTAGRAASTTAHAPSPHSQWDSTTSTDCAVAGVKSATWARISARCSGDQPRVTGVCQPFAAPIVASGHQRARLRTHPDHTASGSTTTSWPRSGFAARHSFAASMDSRVLPDPSGISQPTRRAGTRAGVSADNGGEVVKRHALMWPQSVNARGFEDGGAVPPVVRRVIVEGLSEGGVGADTEATHRPRPSAVLEEPPAVELAQRRAAIHTARAGALRDGHDWTDRTVSQRPPRAFRRRGQLVHLSW